MTREEKLKEVYFNKAANKEGYYFKEEAVLYNKLRGIDKRYRYEESLENRRRIGNENFKSWLVFRNSLSARLEEEHSISKETVANLKELFVRFKYRNKETIKSEEILPFHHEFCKYWKFDIPLHPTNTTLLLHPHWGFFTKMRGIEIDFDTLIDFYSKEIKSSYLRTLKRDYLSNRLTAFNYWDLVSEGQGTLDFSRFALLLEVKE